MRSHLASSAARSARRGSPPIAAAIDLASARTRSVLSCSEPSCVWKVTRFRPSQRASRRCWRSVAQKKAASERRGRTTRSLPATTCAGSVLSMLATAMNHGISAPRGVAHREVALVVLHGGDRHLGRQLEEARVEAAGERHGPLHQRRDLVEQGVGNHRLAAEARGLRRHALADGLAPLVDVGEHLAALVQRRDVGGGRGDAQRLRRHEAVAEGQVRRGDAQDLAGHDVPAEQHQHPVHGPHELRLARAPAHAPGDRQRVERGLHDARQQACGRARPPRCRGAPATRPSASRGARAPRPRRRSPSRRRARPGSARPARRRPP